MERIDITPDVSLLRKSGEVNYKIPDALAELVDNEIDAKLPGVRLRVEVKTGQRKRDKYIEVAGNGRGMSRVEASKAMVMAHSTKTGAAIGEFGMGMKTACSNLGAKFEIITTAPDADCALRLVYDEDEFLRAGKWEIAMEEVPKPFHHGTVITITDLKVNLYAGTKNTLMSRFSKIFKHFIASGDVEIIVNDDAVEPYLYDTIPEYDTPIEFEVGGKRVHGWASLMRRGSGKNQYGFDLIRNNRVVSQYQKLGFSPSAGLTRLIGELHLDEFPVVNNKTDFRRDTIEWDEMEKRLNEEFIADLKRESRRMANPTKFAPRQEAEVDEHIEDLREALKSDEFQEDVDRRSLDAELADDVVEGPIPFRVPGEDSGARTSNEDESSASLDSETPTDTTRQRLQRVRTTFRSLRIEHNLAHLGRDSAYKIWDMEGVDKNKRLAVTTNVDHPFAHLIADEMVLWVKHNIVEAVAELLSRETGKTETMLLYKSDILKHIGKMKLEAEEAPAYREATEGATSSA